jgi:hypothetical protein
MSSLSSRNLFDSDELHIVEFGDDAEEPLLGEVNDWHELNNLVEVERDQSEDLMTLMIGKRISR